MNVIVRQPQVTDAAGTGMAYALLEHERHDGRVDERYWQTHTEEGAVEYWHKVFRQRVQGRRIAVAVTHRRVVGVCGLELAGRTDRFGSPTARQHELFAMWALSEYATHDVYQRMFDFVVPHLAPCQCWVWREDQALRRFLRMNGFTLDGMTHEDPTSGIVYSRLVR